MLGIGVLSLGAMLIAGTRYCNIIVLAVGTLALYVIFLLGYCIYEDLMTPLHMVLLPRIYDMQFCWTPRSHSL